MFFFENNLNFFSEKNAKGGKFAVEWYPMVFFLKNVFFALIMRFFCQKIRKFLNFQSWKIRKCYEVFFRKKNVFIFSKPFRKMRRR